MVLNISHPRRLLVLIPSETSLPPPLENSSHYNIRTPYYSASVPIWRDSLPTTAPTISAFQEEWLSPQAVEVVQAIGSWVICFKKPRENEGVETIRSILTMIRAVIEHHTASDNTVDEPLQLVVGIRQTVSPSLEMNTDQWEDLCRDCGGWEWIDGEVANESHGTIEWRRKERRNEFGETIGLARLQEALEAHDWEAADTADRSDDLDFGFEDGFGAEAVQMEREMIALRQAAHDDVDAKDGDDHGVEELENMMVKIQAIKDMGADMPEAERKRFAAKAVRDMMKTL